MTAVKDDQCDNRKESEENLLEISTDKQLLYAGGDKLLKERLIQDKNDDSQENPKHKEIMEEEDEDVEHKEEQDFNEEDSEEEEEDSEEKEGYPLNTHCEMIPYLRGTDILYFRNRYPTYNWTEKATYPGIYGECRFKLHFGELDQNEVIVIVDTTTIYSCLGEEMHAQSAWFHAFSDRLWTEAADKIEQKFMEEIEYWDDIYYEVVKREIREKQNKIHEKQNKETAEGDRNPKSEDIFSGNEYIMSLMPWRKPNLEEEAHNLKEEVHKKVDNLMKQTEEEEVKNQTRHIIELTSKQKSLEDLKPIAEEKSQLVVVSKSKDQTKTLCFQPTLREAISKEKEKAQKKKKVDDFMRQAKEEEEKKQIRHIIDLTSDAKSLEDFKSIAEEKSLLVVVSNSEDQIKTLCFQPNLDTIIRMQCFESCYFKSNPIKEGYSFDDRKNFDREIRTRFEDTSSFPYSVHGIVRVNFGNGNNGTGTGILIGPDLVLTAAHNIYDCRKTKEKYSTIEFIPGINEKAQPFGSYKVVESYVPDEFLKNWDQEDYALLVLDGIPGNFAGYFGLHVAEKHLLKEKELNVIGYPGYVRTKDEKNELKMLSENGLHQLWGMKGRSCFFQEKGEDGEFLINYGDILTTPGQSGSGVFYEIEGVNEYYVIGVHVLGRGGEGSYNSATWITMKRFDQIARWVGESRRTFISRKIADEGQDGIAIIKELKFNRSSVGDIEADVLSEYVIPHLKSLELQDNSISAKGAAALSKNTWTNLTTLNLADNKIGEKGATALSTNNSWKNLTTLDLRSNIIGVEGATALSENNSWTNLTELYLPMNNIGAEGATALSKNKSWKNLTTLDLRRNNIGAEGANALSKNNSWSNLTALDLELNEIGDEGATALSKNSSWTNLTELYLAYNKIGHEGATGLSTNNSWKNLTALDLATGDIRREDIVGEGRTAILKRWPTIDLGPKLLPLKAVIFLKKN